MSRRSRPLRSALLVGGALTVTLWASVGVAMGSAGSQSLTLAPWHGADYAAEPGAAFEPVSLDLVGELLGREGESFLRRMRYTGRFPSAPGDFTFPDPVAPPREPGDVVRDPGSTPPGTNDPRPTPPPSNDPGPTPGPSPGPTDPPPPQVRRPVLSVSISADRTMAAQGDRINYLITVRNIGDGDASDVWAETHIPAGTTGTDGAACGGDPLLIGGPDSDESVACINANSLVASNGSDTTHISMFFGPILAGKQKTWPVQVRVNNDTPDGSIIRNHAHSWSDQHGLRVNSREVAVVVV